MLGQADRESLGGLSVSSPETRVRGDLELSTHSPKKCFSVPYFLFLVSTFTRSVASKFDCEINQSEEDKCHMITLYMWNLVNKIN